MNWNDLKLLVPGPRVRVSIALFVALLAGGGIGYRVVGGFSWLDAFYQTVTTITTVGFEEIRPFDTKTRVFTMVLIVSGVATFFYTANVIMQQAVEGDLRFRLNSRRTRMRIESMRDHYIVAGFGRVGHEIMGELKSRDEVSVIIEEDEERIEEASRSDYYVIRGDATHVDVLQRAGIEHARCLFAASDSDAGNTFITLTARSLNPNIYIIARAGNRYGAEKLSLAGANSVVSPYTMAGRRMVLKAIQPMAADFMDTLVSQQHSESVLVELIVTPETGLIDLRCVDVAAAAPSARILGIRRTDGEFIVGPRGETGFEDGDVVILIANEDDVALLAHGPA